MKNIDAKMPNVSMLALFTGWAQDEDGNRSVDDPLNYKMTYFKVHVTRELLMMDLDSTEIGKASSIYYLIPQTSCFQDCKVCLEFQRTAHDLQLEK